MIFLYFRITTWSHWSRSEDTTLYFFPGMDPRILDTRSMTPSLAANKTKHRYFSQFHKAFTTNAYKFLCPTAGSLIQIVSRNSFLHWAWRLPFNYFPPQSTFSFFVCRFFFHVHAIEPCVSPPLSFFFFKKEKETFLKKKVGNRNRKIFRPPFIFSFFFSIILSSNFAFSS